MLRAPVGRAPRLCSRSVGSSVADRAAQSGSAFSFSGGCVTRGKTRAANAYAMAVRVLSPRLIGKLLFSIDLRGQLCDALRSTHAAPNARWLLSRPFGCQSGVHFSREYSYDKSLVPRGCYHKLIFSSRKCPSVRLYGVLSTPAPCRSQARVTL